jgi:hypothetical protein
MQLFGAQKETMRRVSETVQQFSEWMHILREILIVAASLLVSTVTTWMFWGKTTVADVRTVGDIWLPIALGGAIALLLAIFVFFLRREPSKVLQLRQELTSAYLNRLADSIKESSLAGKA